MSKIERIIHALSTPAMDAASRFIDMTGKGSVVTGGTLGLFGSSEKAREMVVEYELVWTITDYAAAVSIVGGLVWIAKLSFDMWLSYQKHKRANASK